MTRLIPDTLVLTERNLVRLPRNPELLLGFTVQPIMFLLLFVYVLGGAIEHRLRRVRGLPDARASSSRTCSSAASSPRSACARTWARA